MFYLDTTTKTITNIMDVKDRLINDFADLKMTQDEVDRLAEALKKEEFRKLLVEYAEEISDPANRALYEKELSKLEEERGMSVTFITPVPGYCIKTTQDSDGIKCFINICHNENIEKPSSARETGRQGLMWHLPHTCTQPREDLTNSSNKCIVYDVVFHPDTYRMAETNSRFDTLLADSAFDTIEKSFQVKIDRSNVKKLKNLKFKGRPTASVIRKPTNNGHPIQNDNQNNEQDIVDQIKQKIVDEGRKKTIVNKQKNDEKSSTTPKYSFIYRDHADMQDCVIEVEGDSANNTCSNVKSMRHKELTINIELPLCKSSANVNLDVFEKSLKLDSADPEYKLSIDLPQPVYETQAKAKFDKSKRCLSVTVPIQPYKAKIDSQFQQSDSLQPIEVLKSEEKIEKKDEEQQQPRPQPQPHPQKEIEPSIKYCLPSKVSIRESRRFVYLKFQIPNYDENTFKIDKTENGVEINCESTSPGGYTQYYSACLKFFTDTNNGNNNEDNDGETTKPFEFKMIKFNSKTDLNFKSDEIVELRLEKNDCKKSKQNLTKFATLKKDTNDDDEVKIKFGDESEMAFDSEEEAESIIKQNEAKKVNKMSKKDFIMNFEKIVNHGNQQNDVQLDEDDEIEATTNKSPPITPILKKTKLTTVAEATDKQFEHIKFQKKKQQKEEKKINKEKAKAQQREHLNSVTDDDFEIIEDHDFFSEPEGKEDEEEEEEEDDSLSTDDKLNKIDESIKYGDESSYLNQNNEQTEDNNNNSNKSNEDDSLSSSLNGSFMKLKVTFLNLI
jgi:dynein assembly factor 2, axonemal